ncbi:hypothetical protein [uncultured Algoriphagus sp.]|uniref:hypothetical protein n=1 Tax=uncultured Algoriphagus sp. TaxID=417365 RepID=UPI0030ED7F63|tara:strand:+ start:47860 stop:48273 length:414 start_codon:yes stop_codon:yes gene_type:complete
MVNQTDLSTTQYGVIHEDQIVDSYDLVKGIINDFEGKVNFKIKADSALPLIKGDPQHLKLLFKEFFRKAVGIFNGFGGELNIIHIKDPKSWIFTFFTEGFQQEELATNRLIPITACGEYYLSISKRSIYPQDYILYI